MMKRYINGNVSIVIIIPYSTISVVKKVCKIFQTDLEWVTYVQFICIYSILFILSVSLFIVCVKTYLTHVHFEIEWLIPISIPSLVWHGSMHWTRTLRFLIFVLFSKDNVTKFILCYLIIFAVLCIGKLLWLNIKKCVKENQHGSGTFSNVFYCHVFLIFNYWLTNYYTILQLSLIVIYHKSTIFVSGFRRNGTTWPATSFKII